MSTRYQPTIVGRGLGGQLRQLRMRKRLSLRGVAGQLGWEPSRLSRMENGRQAIPIEDVSALLVVYGITGEERANLLGMAERATQPGWWEVVAGLSTESRTLIHLESEAAAIVNWQPLLVPGLLQTPDYIRAVMTACGVLKVEVEPRTSARLARQAILSRDEPPTLRAILDETVLHRAIGGPRVMARQLHHLVEAAERPNVTLQVVPHTVGAHTGLDGAFALLDFSRNRSVAYLDHKISGLFLEEQYQTDYFRREADRLAEVALSPTESVDFVARVATEHERE